MIPGDRDESAGAGGPTGADPGSDLRFSPRPNRAHEIAWRAWGDEAFDEARRAGKPVLLAISAVWCHWCHVMDETTYSDPRVLSAIAEGYVAVRVDNDRRPDLNRRYNMGGWPTVAFLTPDGEVLTGATYLPPDRLLTVLERVREYYAQHADELTGAAAGGAVAPPAAAAAHADSDLGPAADAVCRAVAALYDPLHGGFGSEPKFPQPDALGLLLAGRSPPRRPASAGHGPALTRRHGGRRGTRPGRARVLSLRDPSATGRRPTTRSCSTTTPASPCSTSTPTPSPGGRPTRRSRATSSTT